MTIEKQTKKEEEKLDKNSWRTVNITFFRQYFHFYQIACIYGPSYLMTDFSFLFIRTRYFFLFIGTWAKLVLLDFTLDTKNEESHSFFATHIIKFMFRKKFRNSTWRFTIFFRKIKYFFNIGTECYKKVRYFVTSFIYFFIDENNFYFPCY